MANPAQPQRVSRTELYEKVWSKAVQHVAAEYGLSGNGLRKACLRLKIPVPPRGYWAMLKSGKPVTKPRLPKITKREPEETWLAPLAEPPVARTSAELTLESEADRIAALEQLDDHRLTVPTALADPHALVALTNKVLTSEKPSDGFHGRPRRERLDCRVSTACVGRALCILDTLLKGLEGRGHAVVIAAYESPKDVYVSERQRRSEEGTYTTCAVIAGVRIAFHLVEEQRTERRWEKNSFGGGWYVRVHVPTGKLTLKLDGETSEIRSSWSDTATQKVEDKLNTCVASLVRLADWSMRRQALVKIKKHRRRVEDRKEKHRQAQMARQKAIAEQQQERLRQRDSNLQQRHAKWAQSMSLRSFAIAVIDHHQIRPDEIEKSASRRGRWVHWVLDQAKNLENEAFQRPWLPLNGLPALPAKAPTQSPTDAFIQSYLKPGLFGSYNFWQRQHLSDTMHGRKH